MTEVYRCHRIGCSRRRVWMRQLHSVTCQSDWWKHHQHMFVGIALTELQRCHASWLCCGRWHRVGRLHQHEL